MGADHPAYRRAGGLTALIPMGSKVSRIEVQIAILSLRE